MEKIKQAIEKANWGRERVPVAIPQGIPLPDVDQFEYQQTRSEAVSPKHLERHRIVAFNKNDPSSLGFDLLRTQVLQKMEERGWRTLAVTSPASGCGKSVVAINLAMSIAHQTGRTSMLVDFDLRRPRVAEYLGLSATPSLNEVLCGEVPLAQALVNPGIPRMVVLPTGRPEAKPAELMASKRVATMIRELRERYHDRVVMFDLPPILAVDDAMAVLPHIDCVLMVVGDGDVTQAEVKESLRYLAGVELLGVVLNKAEKSGKQYSKYARYQ